MMTFRWITTGALIFAAFALAGCAGSSPEPQIPQRFAALDRQGSPRTSCVSTSCIYVTNDPTTRHDSESDVVAFASGTNGNVAPAQTIRGSKTGLGVPRGLALDTAGEIYVADNSLPARILVFAAGANGNVAPQRTIQGPRTGLKFPAAVALDSDGNLYVVDLESESFGSGSVSVFPAGASGNVAPRRKIIGGRTRLDFPLGITLDGSRNLYVTNASQFSSVTIFAAGANGDVKPQRVIFGDKTQLNNAIGIALDAANNVYVANGTGDQVNVYAAAANGNVAPVRVIAGPATKLHFPLGIAIDATGNLDVLDSNSGRPGAKAFVKVYAAGANGDVPPIQNIGGSNTELEFAEGMTLH